VEGSGFFNSRSCDFDLAQSVLGPELTWFNDSRATLPERGKPPRDRKKVKHVKHNGNLTFDEIVAIARTMRPRSMARKLEGTVKEILGTASSVGCTIDGIHPHDVIDKIRSKEIDVPDE